MILRISVMALALVVACKTPEPGSLLKDDETATTHKHQIDLVTDQTLFGGTGIGQARWVKFHLVLSEPDKIWFQNSTTYKFHYDFATKHLPGFTGQTRAQFDAVTLRKAGQKVMLGALVFPGNFDTKEYGIQLLGSEPYDMATIKKTYAAVKKAVGFPAAQSYKDFYLPTFEQEAAAKAGAADLAAAGIETISAARWVSESQCYSGGWAVGRLVQVAADKIDQAFGAGQLKPTDILLTDGVPAEVPPLAGIVSLAPATPNSHVALLAQSFNIPFVFLATPLEKARATAAAGKEVMLASNIRGGQGGGGPCTPALTNVDGMLDETARQVVAKIKTPPAAQIKAMKKANVFHLNATAIKPADVVKVGGKAVGHALLRKAVPANSPDSRAFTFDLWMAFMKQPAPGGGTYGAKIAAMLAPHGAWPPADMKALKDQLKAVRKLIKDAALAPAQQTAVKKGLQGLDPKRNVRFRSSTNVEDTATFSGAGLYDSYSGCLADDTDQGDTGPSLCDATETDEKGVYRAILKVFASFYNDNAYLERLRHKIKEADVGMAIVYHYSFPDEVELANGVITFTRDEFSQSMTIVSQKGAASVTNPDINAQPEVGEAYWFGAEASVSFRQWSSLVTQGQTVLPTEAHYKNLGALARKVSDAFKQQNPARKSYVLDFEYKLEKPNKLILKQVREVPQTLEPKKVVPYLLPSSGDLCVFQGEAGGGSGLFGNQRLKVRLKAETRPTLLDRAALNRGLFDDIVLEHLDAAGAPAKVQGTMDALSGYDFVSLDNSFTDDRFIVHEKIALKLSADETASLAFRTDTAGKVDARYEPPLLTLEDLNLILKVTYTKPRPIHSWEGWTKTTEDAVALQRCIPDAEELATGSSLRERDHSYEGGVRIKTGYWYPPPPQGLSAGYTAWLVRWQGTEISGLTAQPLVLKSYFSQSFLPEHHNFSENFLFWPGADPALPAAQKAELEQKDIVMIYAEDQSKVMVIGKDGTARSP